MDIEKRFIARVIRDRDWRTVLDAHIDETWFEDPEHRAVFGFLGRHYAAHGEVPTVHLVGGNFPNYRVPKVEDSLAPLLEQLRSKRAYSVAVAAFQEAGELLENDRDAAAKAMERVVSAYQQVQLEQTTLQDVDLTKTWQDRIERYRERAERGSDLLGIPTGFETIDRATAGWQKKQFVTIIATPKIGKSTLALRLALNAWEAGYTPLFISFEMSNAEQEDRHDAMLAQISHTAYQRGTLDRNELALLQRALESTEGEHPFLLSADMNSVTTVGGIAAKVEQYRPDVCFVDGLYLLRDELGEPEGSPQALTNITRNLKRLAQRADIPIVGSTQALLSKVNKKKGLQADSVGYSSSFVQDSDVVLGLQADENDEAMRELRVVVSRNCGKISTSLVWDWTTSTFEEPTLEDVS